MNELSKQQIDNALVVFNTIVQYHALTQRNPTFREIRQGIKAVMPSVETLRAIDLLIEWHWIARQETEEVVYTITRVTETRHHPADVQRVVEQAEQVIARQERKARREQATGMFKKRQTETPEQKLARIRSRPHRFTG